MDARTKKLLTDLDDYMDNPPPGTPDLLIEELGNTREMITAPRYSKESPGEQSAREVAEETMPPDAYNQYYPEDGVDEPQILGSQL